MSDYCISTPAALTVAYTATPGVLNGYVSPDLSGKSLYKLVMSTDAWFAQGIDDTPAQSVLASADTVTATGHKLITGMPVQVSALGDTAISQAWRVTNGSSTFVDQTAAANNGTANDVQPFPTSEVANDYFAVGYTTTFGPLKIVLGTSGTVGTLTWEYWNGTAWTGLSGVTDNTTGFTAAPGTYTVVFTVPSDWTARTLNGSASLYYVRAKVLTAYTVDPLITQVFINGTLATGLSAATTYFAIVVDANTYKLATSRANALAGTAIDLTTNGGGWTATTVATKAAGSAFVPAKTIVDLDGAFGAKVSVIQDASGGTASFYPAIPTR